MSKKATSIPLMSRQQIVGMVYNATRSAAAREHFDELLNDVQSYSFENQNLYDAKVALQHISEWMIGGAA